jgi:iron uptake system component EfeO
MPSTPLRIIPAHRRTLASVAAALAFPMALAGCGGTATEPSVGGEPSVARTASESASSADAEFKNLVDAGIGEYSQFVTDEASKLLAGTEAFADAYAAGDEASARDLYAATRMHWERIEPVAESFGELDPKLDAREADLEPGRSGPAGTGRRRTCSRRPATPQ